MNASYSSSYAKYFLMQRLILILIYCASIVTSCDVQSPLTSIMDTSSISDINTCSIEKFSVPLTLEYQVLPEIQDHRFLLGVPNDALSSFRAVPGKGLRGFLEGGEFPDSTALSCAQRCIQDPQCLSFDVENKICYVSHTDRYVHPEAFLDFPSGTYYEWQGIVSTLDIEPNGGVYSTQIAIRFFSSRSSGQIHYKIVSSSIPSTNVSLSTEYQVAISGDVIVLPAFSCRVYAVAVKNGIHASEVFISKEFRIFASKYAYLSPYFNGKEFHGKVVRIQLDISGKKRPRPARFFELSDYESLNGIGPYKKQLSVMDLTLYHPNLRGFQGCFTAFSKANYINETYFIDTTTKNNQPNEAEQVTWRLVLEGIFLPHVNQLSTKTISLDAEYLYLVPGFKDNQPLGTIVRILTGTFTATKPTIELLNLTLIDPSLKGFSHGFTDFKYGYFVPFNNGIAPNFLFGKIVRVDLNNFTPQGVQILDLTSQNPFNVGFSHGFQYNGYGYVIPFQRLLDLTVDEKTILRDFPVPTNGRLVRFQLTNFQTIEVLDLTKAHPFLRGFSGCVQVTNYLYLIPYMQIKKIDSKERNPFSGLLGRVDLRNFQTIEYLDLTNIHPDLKGFRQGFHYKKYVFLIPHRSFFYEPMQRSETGKIVRIDTTNFTPSGVSFLDLPTMKRNQVPDHPDNDLRGFIGGFTSGKYGFLVPYFNGATFSGKICRVDLETFDGIQVLDISQEDPDLKGFYGGTVSIEENPLDVSLFGEFRTFPGTTTPYQYQY